MKKQTTRTCVQCHRKIEWLMTINAESGDLFIHLCLKPDCPNYGLLAVPEELMPKLEKIKKGEK